MPALRPHLLPEDTAVLIFAEMPQMREFQDRHGNVCQTLVIEWDRKLSHSFFRIGMGIIAVDSLLSKKVDKIQPAVLL
jgi:hypothetical protein